jgi:hypothetical protein
MGINIFIRDSLQRAEKLNKPLFEVILFIHWVPAYTDILIKWQNIIVWILL